GLRGFQGDGQRPRASPRSCRLGVPARYRRLARPPGRDAPLRGPRAPRAPAAVAGRFGAAALRGRETEAVLVPGLVAPTPAVCGVGRERPPSRPLNVVSGACAPACLGAGILSATEKPPVPTARIWSAVA